MRISLATYRDRRDLSASDALLADELTRRGHEVAACPWNAQTPPQVPDTDIVVLRSTWDFHRAFADYQAWLDAVERSTTTLLNPRPLVTWNLDKAYLLDLADRGAPVPRLSIVGEGAGLPLWAADRRVVVKPTVGASGVGVELVEAGRLPTPPDGSSVIVQEFVEDVAGGEWALVFFAGQYSHAFQRVPVDGEFRVNAGYGGTIRPGEPDRHLVDLATAVHQLLPSPAVYARIDLLVTAAGPVVMEVEVNEPSLCLHLHPDAPRRFADAILSA